MEKPKPEEKIGLNFRMDGLLSDTLNMYLQRMLHEDNKANWLLAISALILGLAFPIVSEGISLSNIGILIMFITAAISLLLSLLVFSIPKVLLNTSPSLGESVMYMRSFNKKSAEEFISKLREIKSREDIIEQYAYEIINLVNRNISIKIKIIKAQIQILSMGILLGLFFLFLHLFNTI